MDARGRRLEIIRQLLSNGPLASQDIAVRELRLRGECVTQATVSRDFRSLGVLKGPSGYSLGQPEGHRIRPGIDSEEVARVIRAHAVGVVAAGTLVVVRTGAGQAGPVALALDRAAAAEVAGTIAGDDTVFVALRSPGEAKRLARRLIGAMHRTNERSIRRGAGGRIA